MAVHVPEDMVVSVSGFRGLVGPALTPALVCDLAAGFGAFLKARGSGDLVVVGRDSRTSGPMLSRAVLSGLQSVGCHALDLGVVPTPTLLLVVEEEGAAGGIGVTASHNPAQWNALKLASSEGMFLDAQEMGSFRDFLRDGEIPRAAWDTLGDVQEEPRATDRHLDRILALDLLDREGLKRRRFRVALDCVRGAGGRIMPDLLRSLGCEVTGMDLEPDGRFPRDPEPTPENLRGLGRLVRESEADLGLAVDPDVDRLSLVDEEGRAVGEDFTLALAAAVVLRRTPGLVVTNLSTSRVVEDVAKAFGAPLERTPVGEINVARAMKTQGAVVGGEGNGGVILPALHYTRDAPVAAALLLQHLLDEDAPTSDLVGRWPPYRIVKEKLSFPREALEDAYRALTSLEPPEIDDRDGVKLSWPAQGTWLHVRPSGTEPIVRLIAEARDEEGARSLLARARDLLRSVL